MVMVGWGWGVELRFMQNWYICLLTMATDWDRWSRMGVEDRPVHVVKYPASVALVHVDRGSDLVAACRNEMWLAVLRLEASTIGTTGAPDIFSTWTMGLLGAGEAGVGVGAELVGARV